MAAAHAGGAAPAIVREALRCVRSLERVNVPAARPFAELLRAGIAAETGDLAGALRHGAAALPELESLEMRAYAAAISRQLAKLRGESPPEFLPGQNVRNPDAVARMLGPELAPRCPNVMGVASQGRGRPSSRGTPPAFR